MGKCRDGIRKQAQGFYYVPFQLITSLPACKLSKFHLDHLTWRAPGRSVVQNRRATLRDPLHSVEVR